MRVFILSTGRCGSDTIYRACKHIENYTSKHESLVNKYRNERFKYPDNHIEADNRLSWHLGQLDSNFGDEAFYVHLLRNKDKVAASHLNRFDSPISIVNAFCKGIKMTPIKKLSKQEKLNACYDYIETVNSNIEFFLLNKSKKMTINLENIEKDFPVFWNGIGAEGNLSNALKEFKTKYNPTKSNWIKFKIKTFKMLISPFKRKK